MSVKHLQHLETKVQIADHLALQQNEFQRPFCLIFLCSWSTVVAHYCFKKQLSSTLM